ADSSQQIRFKQKDLDRKLVYDRHPRKAFVDHVYPVNTSLEDLTSVLDIERGDFATGTYVGGIEQDEHRAVVRLERAGWADGSRIRVCKMYEIEAGNQELRVNYRLELLPKDRPLHWAVEINVASMAGSSSNRVYVGEQGQSLGLLGSEIDIESC